MKAPTASALSRAGVSSWKRRGRWTAGRRRRGVSDVIATILLLGLTVTLFSAIFAFVTRFPAPPAQSVNEFQASVITGAGGITGLKILQSGGPVVPETDHIYLVASRAVTNWQFSQASGVPVAWGTGNSTKGWGTGQYWTTTFKPALTIPTNVTLYILSSSQLLFTATVPGTAPVTPAVVTSTYTVPNNPAAGAGFQIFAVVSGPTANLVFNVSLAGIPGLSGAPSMTYNATAAAWYYQVPSGHTTTNGTFIAFVQGMNTVTHATISGSVQVVIGSGSGGGSGGTGGRMSVTVGLSVQPQTLTPLQSVYFWAAVSYPGSASGNINVTFWVNETPAAGHFIHKAASYTFRGAATAAVKGPETVTIYSPAKPVFPSGSQAWLIGATVQVQALAVGSAGISGNAVGTTTFTDLNSVTGAVCVSTTQTTCPGAPLPVSHTCTASGASPTCPYLVVTATNGLTAALSVTATVFSNATGHNYGPYTVSSFALAASSTAGSYVTGAQPGLTNNRWVPSAAGTYTLLALVTVSEGGVAIGYIYASVTVNVT